MHFWETKQNKRKIQENKMVILGIKGHFWEVKGHIDLRTGIPATLTFPMEWSHHFWIFPAKIKFQTFF